jgi:hypothetical protein
MSQSSNDRADEQLAATGLSDTERHDLLASDRRRTVLAALDDRATPVELTALAAAVARREADTTGVGEDRLRRVTVALHHVHLPKLDDFGVVAYDPDARRVERVESAADARVH